MRYIILIAGLFLCPYIARANSIVINQIVHSEYCDGSPSGSIDLEVQSALAPFSYVWNGPNNFESQEEDIFDLEPGEYCVTVTNSLCGVATICVEVECLNDCPIIELEDLDDALTNPTDCNSTDGIIYFRFGGPAGGTEPYVNTLHNSEGDEMTIGTYGWSNLAADVYSLTVADANGCTADFEIELTPETGATIVDHHSTAPCEGEANGALEIFVIGALLQEMMTRETLYVFE